jgi:hypothetical protein
MQTKDVFTQEVRKALSTRAVNQLIADAEAGHLVNNKELAEVIAGCIRHTDSGDLQTLKNILDQHQLEGVSPWDKDKEPEQRGRASPTPF